MSTNLVQHNLLDKWLNDVMTISSPMNPNRKVGRRQIEFIHERLLKFFGVKYFNIKVGADSTIEDTPWLFSLLSSGSNMGCIMALLEIATLLQYVDTLDENLKKELRNLKRSPVQLRSFFFELFIYKHLDQAGIPNKKKFMDGTREVEGSCTMADKEFLFECRKVFMPKFQELDIKRRLIMDFDKYGKLLTRGIGMIGTIHFKWPINKSYRGHFGKHIKDFFERLESFPPPLAHIDYQITDSFGTFKVQDYNETDLIEIKGKNDFDILHYIIPPKVPVPGVPNHYQGKIQTKFFTAQSKILQKLETVLKEKRKQHRNSEFTNQIIFVDSETLPEFHMGLFVNDNMLETDKVAALCNKIHSRNIVCLIRRRFLSEGYEVLADCYGNESYRATMNTIENLFRLSLSICNIN